MCCTCTHSACSVPVLNLFFENILKCSAEKCRNSSDNINIVVVIVILLVYFDKLVMILTNHWTVAVLVCVLILLKNLFSSRYGILLEV